MDPKRSDQRQTPTRPADAMEISPPDKEPFIEVRRHKSKIFNPYKEDSSQGGDKHDAVRRARPSKWGAHSQPRPPTRSLKQPPPSPSLPAEEANPSN